MILLIPLIAGIVFAYLFPVSTVIFFGVACLTVPVALVAHRSNSKWNKRIFPVCIAILAFSAGAIRWYDQRTEPIQIPNGEVESIFLMNVQSPAQPTAYGYKLRANITPTDTTFRASSSDFLAEVYLDSMPDPDLGYGDQILVNAKPASFRAPLNPGDFDYGRYMLRQGVRARLLVDDQIGTIDRGVWYHPIRLAQQTAGFIEQRVVSLGLESDQQAVLLALLTGNKSGMDSDLKQGFAGSGITHILAVSGMHVGIIYTVIVFLLGFTKYFQNRAVQRTAITIAALTAYAFVTGLGPSVVRAVVMFAIMDIGRVIRRDGFSLNTLAVAAVVMLIYKPVYLLDVGFQLSFLAVGGILVIQPWLSGWLVPVRENWPNWVNKFTKAWWSMTTVTLAAQISTFPATVFYFHQFPTYFLPANLLVLPLVSVIMPLAIAAVALSNLPFLGSTLTFVLKLGISCMNHIAITFSSLPGAIVESWYMQLPETYLWYTLILLLAVYFTNRSSFAYAMSLVAIIAIGSIHLMDAMRANRLESVSTYKHSEGTVLEYVRGDEVLLIVDSVSHRQAALRATQYSRMVNHIEDYQIATWDSVIGGKEKFGGLSVDSGIVSLGRFIVAVDERRSRQSAIQPDLWLRKYRPSRKKTESEARDETPCLVIGQRRFYRAENSSQGNLVNNTYRILYTNKFVGY